MTSNSLEKREESFKNKLNSQGKFTYIKDYKGYKHMVIVKHNKCNSIIDITAETVINKNKADICKGCSSSIRFKTVEELNEMLTDANFKVLAKGKNKKGTLLIRCKKCNQEYNITYNQFKTGSISCCNEKGNLYKRHVSSVSKQILRAMRPNYAFNSFLYDYIYEYIGDISYIKSKTVDKKNFALDIYKYINNYYKIKRIAFCEECNEIKRGNEWGSYKDNFENKVCYKCLKNK